MTHARIIPIADHRPVVDSWVELDAWLAGSQIHEEGYLDGEVAQASGWESQVKHRAKLEVYTKVREQIAHLVDAERRDRDEASRADRIEAEYRDAGFEDMEPTIARLMDGDR